MWNGANVRSTVSRPAIANPKADDRHQRCALDQLHIGVDERRRRERPAAKSPPATPAAIACRGRAPRPIGSSAGTPVPEQLRAIAPPPAPSTRVGMSFSHIIPLFLLV